MRLGATVFVAALLVVAGCVSPIASGDDGKTATPEPTTAEPETPTKNETTDTDDGQDVSPPDPDSDRIGWEDGYWYNETIDVDNTDGLTDAEFEKVLARAQPASSTSARGSSPRTLRSNASVPTRARTSSGHRKARRS